MIRTKSVGSPIDRSQDGLRILATRFRGRGMTRDRYDVCDAVARTERAAPPRCAGRTLDLAGVPARYRQELVMDGPVDARSKTIKNHGAEFTLRCWRGWLRISP